MWGNIQKFRPFSIILLAVIMLVAISYIDLSFTYKDIHIKDIDILQDLKPHKTKDLLHNDSLLARTNTQTILNIDSLTSFIYRLNIDSIVALNKKDLRIIQYHPSDFFLENFFSSLKTAQDTSQKVRIAYFGDSMIEGDLISQSLRHKLQETYGGQGVGFVPITSIVAAYRRSIVHHFSNDWTSHVITKPSGSTNYGLSGFVFNPTILNSVSIEDATPPVKGSFVKYATPKNAVSTLSHFSKTTLFYGPSNEKTYIKYSIDGNFYTAYLKGTKRVNALELTNNKLYNELFIEFFTDTILDVYGVSFEADTGVYIDNYSVRGNHGIHLQKIQAPIIKEFNSYLDYKLLIFQYGLNVAAPHAKSFKWYETAFTKVINYYKETFPNADILIISIGDKSIKEDMAFVTQPSVPILVETQRAIAQQTESHFWNLFQNMGGYNSMPTWVEAKQPMASKDYTHITFKGAEHLADLLYANFVNEYDLFLHKTNNLSTKSLLLAALKNKPLTPFTFKDFYSIIDTQITPLSSTDTDYLTDTSIDSVITEILNNDPKTDLPVFRVQFMASTFPLKKLHYEEILKVYDENKMIISADNDGYYRYMFGDFKSFNEAKEVKKLINGINKDAFIIGYYQNSRISTEKAINILKKNN